MSRYLATALVAEGASDYAALCPLLERALEELCLLELAHPIEIAPVQRLTERSTPGIGEIVALADEAGEQFDVIFVHRDQGARPDRVQREWINPLRERWKTRPDRMVPVVPVREMEAWLLADGDALRGAFGIRKTDLELGVPSRPQLVEDIEDPKNAIAKIGAIVRRRPSDNFARLAEEVSIARLREVAAFDEWWRETGAVLREIGFQ